MAKTVIEFLNELAQRELASPKIVDSLRRQVGDTVKPVSAAAIARLLVEKGHLTRPQAENLLGAPLAPPKKPHAESLPETKPMDSELGLLPLEPMPPSAPPPSHAPAANARPADATTALEPLDLGLLDLLPLDEPQPPAPARPAAGQTAAKRPPPARLPVAAPLEPLAPPGALQPLADPLASVPAPEASPPKPAGAAAPPAAPAAAPQRSAGFAARRWWLGGIALGLVVLASVGGGLAILFFRGDRGPDPLELAEQDYRAGRYAAAAEKYDSLLARYPRHEQAGLARVHRGLARMLAAQGSDNWPAVLPVAEAELDRIGGEASLHEAHAELAPLLTEMAAGLSQRAADAADNADARLDEARRALALADNGRYVPGPLRDWQRLARVAESLAALDRRQQSQQALEAFLPAASQDLDAGQFAPFLAKRAKLLEEYPELAADPQLMAAVAKGAAAAAAAITPVSELPQARAGESDSPAVIFSAADEADPVYVARADDALWALNANTGKLLWRRTLASVLDPVPLSAGGLLAVDDRANEVLRLDRQTGELKWTLAAGSALAGPPLVAGNRIAITTTGGRLFLLDPDSGNAMSGCQLPLAAAVGAALDPAGQRLYQAAEQDYVFVLSADKLEGAEGIYTGHAPLTLYAPPVVLPGRLIAAECRGLDRTVLHALALDGDGRASGKREPLTLAGQILTPPAVFGDRLIAATDHGKIAILQIPADSAVPVKTMVDLSADSRLTQLSYCVLSGDQLCVAGSGLALFPLTADGQSLLSKWSRFAGDSFSSMPEPRGGLLLAVRRSPNRGFFAAALKTADGQVVWETALSEPQEAAR